jgi:myo-inositol 2-dehydrogenase/D-chiro-inositol 1-dehydrogenase
MSTITPLRVGIAGLGRLGARHAANLAHNIRHCNLAAACSPVEAERAFARDVLGVPTIFDNIDDLISSPLVDAVVLVTPTSLHANQTIAALQAGKHVFVEKPLALNVADCERVLAVAAHHPHLVAMVGFVRRFDASYQAAQASVAAHDIGQPFLVRSQTCDQNDPAGFFVQYAPASGGIFMDCSVHDIDLARWFLGHPKALRAYATGTNALHPALAEFGDVDNGIATVEFEGGAKAVFYASRTMAHGHETSTEIIGTAGKLLVGEHAAADRIVRSDAHGVRHAVVKDFYQRFEAAFNTELTAFVEACQGRQPLTLTLSDALEATRIGLAVTRSLHSGQVEII